MKKTFKALLSLVLCITVIFVTVSAAGAASFGEINNSEMFYCGNDYGACNLAALTMLLRRVYVGLGRDWKTVTQDSVQSACCMSGSYGLLNSSTYYNSTYPQFLTESVNIESASFSGGESALKSLLEAHPEGILLYNGNYPHGLLVTDYSNGQFYCVDYDWGTYGNAALQTNSAWRTPLKESCKNKVTPENATKYWYVSSVKTSVEGSAPVIDIGSSLSLLVNLLNKFIEISRMFLNLITRILGSAV